MKNPFRKLLAAGMITTILSNPLMVQLSYADEFGDVCSKSLEDVKQKKSTEGDQKAAYCVQADLADEAYRQEGYKALIYTAATAFCTAAIWITEFGGDAVCMATGGGAMVAGLGFDMYGKHVINKAKEQYGESKDQICSIDQFTPLITSAATAYGVATAVASATSSSTSGCVACAVGMALLSGMSWSSYDSALKTHDKLVKAAKEVSDASEQGVTNLEGSQVNAATNQTAPASNSGGSAPSAPASSGNVCASANGNAYLECLGNTNPEIAALTNNSAFMNAMKKGLKGKTLGDFVKGYQGKTRDDMANYIASNMGVPLAGVKKSLENMDKIVKDTRFLENHRMMAYNRNPASQPKVAGDLDFSKMMNGVLGKMNLSDDQKKKADPSELVFRQMELLSADKIESNKDISLFARVAFRYRKITGTFDSEKKGE